MASGESPSIGGDIQQDGDNKIWVISDVKDEDDKVTENKEVDFEANIKECVVSSNNHNINNMICIK